MREQQRLPYEVCETKLHWCPDRLTEVLNPDIRRLRRVGLRSILDFAIFQEFTRLVLGLHYFTLDLPPFNEH